MSVEKIETEGQMQDMREALTGTRNAAFDPANPADVLRFLRAAHSAADQAGHLQSLAGMLQSAADRAKGLIP